MSAQSTQESQSRHLFEEGLQALAEGRFAQARDHLRESVAILPRVATAYNLALALRGTGESLDALSVLDALIAGEYGEVSVRIRQSADELRGELQDEVAVIIVRFEGATRATVLLDGRSQGELDDGARILVNGGRHTLAAELGNARSERTSLVAERGLTQTVNLHIVDQFGTLTARAADGVLEIVGVTQGRGVLSRSLPPGTYEVVWRIGDTQQNRQVSLEAGAEEIVAFEASSSSTTRRRRRWILSILGVAVVGAAATAAIIFSGSQPPPPTNEGVFGVTEALTSF